MMIGTVIMAFVISAISTSLGLLARSKNGTKERLDATLRADAALREIRANLISLTRSDDLFDCQFYLTDGVQRTAIGEVDRDEVLFFNTALRPVRDIDYNGEGLEYETQYRVEDDSLGPALWHRRDPVPDQYTFGGGQASPLVEGIVGLSFEAYDGFEWLSEWRSDDQGLPKAVRITLIASGHRMGEDPYEDTSFTTLRTVVPFDRVTPLQEYLLPSEEELALLGLEDVFGTPLIDVDGESGDAGSGGNDNPNGLDQSIIDAINNSGVTNMDEVNDGLSNRPPPRPGSGGSGDE